MSQRPTLADAWNGMASWSTGQARRNVEAFMQRQPAVGVVAMAYLEDEGREPVGLALRLVMALESVYGGMLGRVERLGARRVVTGVRADDRPPARLEAIHLERLVQRLDATRGARRPSRA